MPSNLCSAKDWNNVTEPKKNSHKGDNGRLLIFGGSEKFHGALILSVLSAVRFSDLVNVYTNPSNRSLIRELKLSTPNVIVQTDKSLAKTFASSDAYLVGPGWSSSPKNKKLLKKILKTKKPAILDATALKLLDKSMLHKNVLLTPHRGEFRSLFSLDATYKNVKRMAKKYDCTILCKGPIDFIASSSSAKQNKMHNVGMTKGGTGDILAGFVSALIASHTKIFDAACASIYVLGYSGFRLSKIFRTNYSSKDVIDELPFAISAL